MTTSTPGLSRSSQVLMPFGLPLRVTIVTTEPNGMPLCSFWFQVSSTWPDFTRRVTSGSTREVDDVGRQAGLDLARLVAGGAVGLAERDALALRRLLEQRDDLVEADLGHGVGDERELRRRRRRRRRPAGVVAADFVAGAAAAPPRPGREGRPPGQWWSSREWLLRNRSKVDRTSHDTQRPPSRWDLYAASAWSRPPGRRPARRRAPAASRRRGRRASRARRRRGGSCAARSRPVAGVPRGRSR